MCVCVCVCVRERERESERQTDRQTDREQVSHTQPETHSPPLSDLLQKIFVDIVLLEQMKLR